VARNLSIREDEVPHAEAIVEEEIRRFARWLGGLEALPTVGALREHANTIVDQVLAENAGRWESASPRDLARVEAIAKAVSSRLLHEPTIRLRSLPEERRHPSLQVIRELFGLTARGEQEHEDDEQLPDNVRTLKRRSAPDAGTGS
jgi:glutamyl-tRNA reductase